MFYRQGSNWAMELDRVVFCLRFFSRYIRDLLDSVAGSGVGCFIGDQCVNILAYADDLALPAPSWHALQLLLNILSAECCLGYLI